MPGRTDLDYVRAVRTAIRKLGISTNSIHDESTDPSVGRGEWAERGVPRRSAIIGLNVLLYCGGVEWAESAVLRWDEENGWTVTVPFLPGGVRGTHYARYGLGLDLVPTPDEAARHVVRCVRTDPIPYGSPRQLRTADEPDSALEAALAAYLSP